jgi:hypothetical protein
MKTYLLSLLKFIKFSPLMRREKGWLRERKVQTLMVNMRTLIIRKRGMGLMMRRMILEMRLL